MGAYAKCGCVGEALKTDWGLETCVWGDSKLTLTCWIFYKNESENSALSVGSNSARCMRSIVCVLVGDGVLYRNACVLYETNYICTLWSPTVIQDSLPDLTDEAVPNVCTKFSQESSSLYFYRGHICLCTISPHKVSKRVFKSSGIQTSDRVEVPWPLDWLYPDIRHSYAIFSISTVYSEQRIKTMERFRIVYGNNLSAPHPLIFPFKGKNALHSRLLRSVLVASLSC